MKRPLTIAVAVFAALLPAMGQRTDILLEKGWEFSLGDSGTWEEVRVPHDWAITGPFDISNDLQTVAVVQDGEKHATLKTGRTGGLPYVGKGRYRRVFTVPEGKAATLLFEGAMSRARVIVNGTEVCRWPYGYNSFHCDITSALASGGGENLLEVELENLPMSSRWYPGAGLFRPVHLITTSPVHIPVWGTYVTTPQVGKESASVRLETKLVNLTEGESVSVETQILDPDGVPVAVSSTDRTQGNRVIQEFVVASPRLWSPEKPSLYVAESRIVREGVTVDVYRTRFGIRSLDFVPGKGFFLNGELRKFKGVCNHHDLGPLGAAVNESAIRLRLRLLKDMGCDAIRTTHNMPSPELVSACDEMGFMMIVEPFDEWDIAKCTNGYHLYFDEWAERDMENMLHQFRNSASVVLWSIGNEVPDQCSPEGYKVARFLQDICHREDPTRKVTCGMDRLDFILDNGFGRVPDIPGLNYRTFRYEDAYSSLPQGFILGSETASTVSSRGVYHLPARLRFNELSPDHQCSSYDLDACSWSNVPDIDFSLAEDYPWTLGQFVWTGFDYLGEPSPYSTDSWPNHSSMFGIIDLASIPKDRFYLYRSVWNTQSPTLHVLPHWNWKKGQNVPVFVYTSYPSAELFVNGVSQGRLFKEKAVEKCHGDQRDSLQLHRYRLIWKDVQFRKGEIKVVAYDADGAPAEEKTVRTAGRPRRIVLSVDTVRPEGLTADGKDLAFIRIEIVDRHGNPCPGASHLVRFNVSSQGRYLAADNGDPTCLDAFHLPRMHAFGGKLTAIVEASETPGILHFTASARGLAPATIDIPVVGR